MTVVEKAAYLKGLVEGFGIDPQSQEGKLWGVLNELLSGMAHEIEDLQAANLDHAEALDVLADELSYLEELTGETDTAETFEDFDGEEPRSGCGCGGCPIARAEQDEDFDDEEDDEEDEPAYDGVIYDATCPVCVKEISFDEETLAEGSIRCPACGELLEFDLDGEEDDEDEDDDN